MRYPNLRYGSPDELRFYAQGMTVKDLAKRLRRSERSVNEWLAKNRKIPWWIPEILRLQQMAHREMMQQMRMRPTMKRLGIVSGSVIEFRQPVIRKSKAVLHDADTADEVLKARRELSQLSTTRHHSFACGFAPYHGSFKPNGYDQFQAVPAHVE